MNWIFQAARYSSRPTTMGDATFKTHNPFDELERAVKPRKQKEVERAMQQPVVPIPPKKKTDNK